MQTRIGARYRNTAQGREADAILRACVHCGFCTATCPTYQLLGDERDSPRGRIYLIKQLLEEQPVGRSTQQHLDRCLTCRACETTCPSGVRYGRLIDIGRELLEHHVPRPLGERLKRALLRRIIPHPARLERLLKLGRICAPLLPPALRRKLPAKPAQTSAGPIRKLPRRMLLLAGCAQRVATPATNAAARRVFQALGIQLVEAREAGCCGAVSQHLAAPQEAADFMRRNIDAWWPHIQQGAEAIVVTASGCGVQVKEYGELLQNDPAYGEKARRISELARDAAEVLRDEGLPANITGPAREKIAFHSPCTLQHGQKLAGVVENLLREAGFELLPVADAHLCCGSAGTYSLLQPELSQRLLQNKLGELEKQQPVIIATANVGCQLHLATGTGTPVQHWLELLAQALDRDRPSI